MINRINYIVSLHFNEYYDNWFRLFNYISNYGCYLFLFSLFLLSIVSIFDDHIYYYCPIINWNLISSLQLCSVTVRCLSMNSVIQIQCLTIDFFCIRIWSYKKRCSLKQYYMLKVLTCYLLLEFLWKPDFSQILVMLTQWTLLLGVLTGQFGL